MGGRSSSSQRSETTNEQYSQVNDGEYAGMSGTVDNSDNSQETNIDYREETDNSVEMDGDYIGMSGSVDNSENDFEYTDESDNSINGEYAGNSGTINALDGGAIEKSFELGMSAIDANSGVSKDAMNTVKEVSEAGFDAMEETTEQAFGFGSGAIDSVKDTAEAAIKGVSDSQKNALEFGVMSIDEVGESAQNFAGMLTELQQDYIQSNQQGLNFLGEQSGENLEMVAELARNTALEGQDIVANQSTKIATYALVASGVFVVAMVFVIGVKK